MAGFMGQTLRGHDEYQGKVGGRARSHMMNAHGTVKELSSCTLVMKVYLNAITCIAQTCISDMIAHITDSCIPCCLPNYQCLKTFQTAMFEIARPCALNPKKRCRTPVPSSMMSNAMT